MHQLAQLALLLEKLFLLVMSDRISKFNII